MVHSCNPINMNGQITNKSKYLLIVTDEFVFRKVAES
jgi:hypothetical protein